MSEVTDNLPRAQKYKLEEGEPNEKTEKLNLFSVSIHVPVYYC